MKENKTQKKHECQNCHCAIDFGTGMVVVETAVNGPRELVPLGDHYEFCGTRCAAEYLQSSEDDDSTDLSARIS